MRLSWSFSSDVLTKTTVFAPFMFGLQSVGLPPNSGKKLGGRPAPEGLNKKPRSEPGLAIIVLAVTLFTPAFSVSSALGLTLSRRCAFYTHILHLIVRNAIVLPRRKYGGDYPKN